MCCPFDGLAAHQAMIELLGATVLTIIIALEYWTKSAFLQTWIFHASEGIIKWVLNQ